jgi:hypothetical protein
MIIFNLDINHSQQSVGIVQAVVSTAIVSTALQYPMVEEVVRMFVLRCGDKDLMGYMHHSSILFKLIYGNSI